MRGVCMPSNIEALRKIKKLINKPMETSCENCNKLEGKCCQ